MKFLATIAILFCANLFACDESASQPGMFPIDDEARLAAVVTTLQAAVSSNDKNAVADLIEFPVSTQLQNQRRKLDRQQFLAHYDDIIDAKVRASVLAARFRSRSEHACVFWNSQGFMFGDGEIWINQNERGEPKIVTINNGSS
jgi:hypothetical protein